MSKFNPVEAADAVTAAYSSFLASSFTPRRNEVAKAYLGALENAVTTQATASLLLEPKRTFKQGVRIADLVEEGTLAPTFTNLIREDGLHPFLYDHQERAVRASIDGMRNVVIATGTGSGKTEAFLIPIVNGLIREHEAGLLTTNVKAILLYPMNALANDQMKRIREIFKQLPSEITFGRYIGATEYKQVDAERDWQTRNGLTAQRPINELISRDVMDETPPHLLLTNYAMLERLLLLPKSNSLFSDDLQWIVLDEVHSYDGARGTEMAFLLRRLRQRTVGTRGRLQCFAASATLGSGVSSAPDVANYATELFDEPFETSGVITPTHIPVEIEEGTPPLESAALTTLGQNRLINLDDAAWAGLKEKLRENPASLPVRYHQIVRSPAGAFICLSPQHPDSSSAPRIILQPGRSCVACSNIGVESRLIELAACRSCGAEYLRGRERSGRLEVASPQDETPTLLLLGTTRTPLDPPDITSWSPGEDSAEKDDSYGEAEVDHSPKSVCTGCLKISEPTAACDCGCSSLVDVFVSKTPNGVKINRCLNCGYAGTGFGPIARAVAGVDSLSAVLASSLYSAIPPDPEDRSPAGARKLLAFSDSRQDAAYFAPFLEVENQKLLRRQIIFQSLNSLGKDKAYRAPWESDVVAAELARTLDAMGLARGNTATQKARTWLRAELIPRDRKQSLEGVGLLRCSLDSESLTRVVGVLRTHGVERPETVIRMLVDTMRLDGAVGTQGSVDPSDPIFTPLLAEHQYILKGKTQANLPVHRWVGSERETKNRRTRLVRKALNRAGSTAHEVDVLEEIWNVLVDDEVLAGKDGRFNIPLDSWYYDNPQSGRHFCEVCRRWTWLGGTICPTPSCTGTPIAMEQPSDYWGDIYNSNGHVQSMSVLEHTAQWTSDEAQRIQEEFIEGRVNVLSCSTTFEMGVDVGAVQAVLCRNVPPTPANYIQRAGRAGRRAGDASLAVTLARTRSHDAYYAAQPERLVAGTVPVPSIDIDNADLARRHLYAAALSTFLSEKTPDLQRGPSSGYFFEPDDQEPSFPSPSERFAAWLKEPELTSVPADDLGFTDAVKLELGIPTPATWVDTLTSTDVNKPGPLTVARQIYTDNINIVRERRAEVSAKITDPTTEHTRRAKMNSLETVLFRTEDTLRDQDAIGELANNGVLPKYGFPVDVIALYPLPGESVKSAGLDKLNLTRDLRIALREYAPGNEVIAAGNIVRSVGLKTLAGYNLLTFEFVTCDQCDWFSHQLIPDVGSETNLPDFCGSCGGAVEKRRFVEPRYGFIGEVQKDVGGSRRPISRTGTKTYLSYEADLSHIDAGGSVELSPKLSFRGGRVARRLTLTTSPQQTCLTCGYVELESKKKAQAQGHRNYRSADPKAMCAKPTYAMKLGHAHRTELLELRLLSETPLCVCGDAVCGGAWRSLAAALAVGAARLLKVSTRDIDADITGGREPRVLIFDTAAGGAGYTKAVGSKIPELLQSALDVVQNCVCTLDGSCYQCLRNYQNQTHHEHLSRSSAQQLLVQAIASL